MPSCPDDRSLLVLFLVLLSFMVVVTSHPDNNIKRMKTIKIFSRLRVGATEEGVVHKRSIGTGGVDSKVGANVVQTGLPNPFSTANGTVVIAQTGGTATLPCNTKKHNTAVVSWIRKRDYHLLTVGGSTYSHDARFIVQHARHVPSAWPLVVRRVQRADRGIYECQLATHPPASILLELRVHDAYAEVEGAPDIHVRSGSELRLICRLKDATEPPAFLFWYHGDRMINYDLGVRVTTPVGVPAAGASYASELVLPAAAAPNAGAYACMPSNARPANVTVHVHDDAACPPFENQTRVGGDAGLIVQCPLATKDRQEVKKSPTEVSGVLSPRQVTTSGRLLAASLVIAALLNCRLIFLH